MAHALLLVLIGVMSADEPGIAQSVPDVGKAQPATSAQAKTAGPFQVAPLVLGNVRGVVPFPPFVLHQGSPGTSSTDDQIVQLQNKRIGVTCGMRIVKVEPSIDPGILAPSSAPHPDSIVRNSHSPCVE